VYVPSLFSSTRPRVSYDLTRAERLILIFSIHRPTQMSFESCFYPHGDSVILSTPATSVNAGIIASMLNHKTDCWGGRYMDFISSMKEAESPGELSMEFIVEDAPMNGACILVEVY